MSTVLSVPFLDTRQENIYNISVETTDCDCFFCGRDDKKTVACHPARAEWRLVCSSRGKSLVRG